MCMPAPMLPTPAPSSAATQKTCANGANSKTSTLRSETSSFPPLRHLCSRIERLSRQIHEPIHPHHSDTLVRQLWQHHPPRARIERYQNALYSNSPFDCLIKQIEDGQDYADDDGQPYTTEQLLRIAYTLVLKTGLYFEDCKIWNSRPAAARTWDNFKTHFQNAQCLLCDQMCHAQPNELTSTATLHTINHFQQPNPQRNIRNPLLTWHPLPPLIANSSQCSQLPLLPLTNTSTNSTKAPQTHHPLSKPTLSQPPPQQPCPLSPPP